MKKKGKKSKKSGKVTPSGKQFNITTTLDYNPYMFPVQYPRGVADDALALSQQVIYDPLIGRQLFVCPTPMGPITTVPTVLPHQMSNFVNMTGAYNDTVKKLINHVPTSSAILRGTKVFARWDQDGLYYLAMVQEHVKGNTFVVEFDSCYGSGFGMQKTGAYDMISFDDAMRHSVGEGDSCLAPVDCGPTPYAPGKILFDDNISRNEFRIHFWHGPTKNVNMEQVCWIPDVLYERIVCELRSPQARLETVTSQEAKFSKYNPLDMFLNGTPKYMLQTGSYLPPNVVSPAWYPTTYQGYSYIPTFPVPWLPHYWPTDVSRWPQYLLPYRQKFDAAQTVERLPGSKISINEFNEKVEKQIEKSHEVMVSTSRSDLEKMESFLSKHDDETLAGFLKDKKNHCDCPDRGCAAQIEKSCGPCENYMCEACPGCEACAATALDNIDGEQVTVRLKKNCVSCCSFRGKTWCFDCLNTQKCDGCDGCEKCIKWNIPDKETCDIGENTVISIRHDIKRRIKQAGKITEERPPWKKYVKPDDEKHIPSIIHSGKFTRIENIHGYTDDDYTAWKLKARQLRRLESLHERKTRFMAFEENRHRQMEEELVKKLKELDVKSVSARTSW